MTTKEKIAYQISLGKLSMPRINNLESKFGSAVYKEIEAMFEAMFNTYLKKGAHIICVLFNALASECVDLSEVVELTKIFGTEESSRFVNGVLGKIARQGAEKNEKPDN